MENASSTGSDIGAYIFFIVLILVFFVLPGWLMYRHYQKSKPKIQAEKEAYDRLAPAEKLQQKKAAQVRLATTAGIVAGVLIGSRLLDNFFLGIILGALLGAIARSLTDRD